MIKKVWILPAIIFCFSCKKREVVENWKDNYGNYVRVEVRRDGEKTSYNFGTITLLSDSLTITLEGDSLSTTNLNSEDSIAPIEGDEINIGNQIWMTNNLSTINFRNGDNIYQAVSHEDWAKAGECGEPAWCYYFNDSLNHSISGILYNWYAVVDPRGIAPIGWRIPSIQDWEILSYNIGKAFTEIPYEAKYSWKTAPFFIRTSITPDPWLRKWAGGSRSESGYFYSFGESGSWWTTTDNENYASYFGVRYRNYINSDWTGGASKGSGFSVRCIRDIQLQSQTRQNITSYEAGINNDSLKSDSLAASKKPITTTLTCDPKKLANDLTRNPEKVLPTTLVGLIDVAKFNPNGEQIIIADGDGRRLSIWSARNGNAINLLETSQYANSIRPYRNERIVFSANGKKTLVITELENFHPFKVSVWDNDICEPTIILCRLQKNITEGFFVNDDKTIVLNQGNQITFWNTSTGQLENTIWANRTSTDVICLSNSKGILAICENGKIRFWDIQKQYFSNITIDHGLQITKCVFSNDDKVMVTSSAEGYLQCWDLTSGKKISEIDGNGIVVKTMNFQGMEMTVLINSELKIYFWDPLSGNQLHEVNPCYPESCRNIEITPDGERIISITISDTIVISDLSSLKELYRMKKPEFTEPYQYISLNPSGDTLMLVSYNTIYTWSLESGNPILTIGN
jgi:uncharacterized protein (TIGR02145 family)